MTVQGVAAAVGHLDDGPRRRGRGLQDPPEVIPQMVQLWRDGNDVVYGLRTDRQGESKFKLWTAKVFYRLINRLSETKMPFDTGDFRLLDRRVVQVINDMPERARFLRGMVSWTGFKQVSLPYEREEISLRRWTPGRLPGSLSKCARV